MTEVEMERQEKKASQLKYKEDMKKLNENYKRITKEHRNSPEEREYWRNQVKDNWFLWIKAFICFLIFWAVVSFGAFF